MKKATFLGLGVMGYHMAKHLANAKEIKLTVYNRSSDKLAKWHQAFPDITRTNQLDKAVCDSDFIFMCLGRDEDVLSVTHHSDFLSNIKKGAIIVDHTTTSYDLCMTLNKTFTPLGAFVIDAPVSGGEIGAVNGNLTAMLGGESHIIKIVEPLLKCYTSNITHLGKAGSGQLAKMVNQICISGILQGLSEGLKFAENENLDIDKLIKAISGGAAQSWQMENRALTMHHRKFDFGFALNWMIKDLSYCIQRAQENKTNLVVTKNTLEQYKKLSQKGFGHLDTSALISADD